MNGETHIKKPQDIQAVITRQLIDEYLKPRPIKTKVIPKTKSSKKSPNVKFSEYEFADVVDETKLINLTQIAS